MLLLEVFKVLDRLVEIVESANLKVIRLFVFVQRLLVLIGEQLQNKVKNSVFSVTVRLIKATGNLKEYISFKFIY